MTIGRMAMRLVAIAGAMAIAAGACGGSETGPTTSAAGITQATGSLTPTTSDPGATTTGSLLPNVSATTSTLQATTGATSTSVPSPSFAMNADELCELLPVGEIGVVMHAQSDVVTFASPSQTSVICLLLIFNGETSLDVSIELVNSGGASGLEAEAAFVSSIYGDVFEIEDVADRAVGFENNNTQILMQTGDWVVRIIGSPEELYSLDQASEIGRLVAASLS